MPTRIGKLSLLAALLADFARGRSGTTLFRSGAHQRHAH